MNHEKTIAILKRFCLKSKSPGSNREKLLKPFNIGNYTFASDGCSLVRVPRLYYYDKNSPQDFSSIIFPDYKTIDSWVTLPELELCKKCPMCEGKGVVERCRECNGTGRVRFTTDYSRYFPECKKCEGDGISTGGEDSICDLCMGTKEDPHETIMIKKVKISRQMIKKIKSLPNAKWSLKAPGELFPFIFDGGEGMAIPYSTP